VAHGVGPPGRGRPLLDQALATLARAYALRVRDGSASRGADLLRDPFGLLAVEVVHHHGHAVARELEAFRAPDAAAATRHDSRFPVENPHLAPCPLCSCPWLSLSRRRNRRR